MCKGIKMLFLREIMQERTTFLSREERDARRFRSETWSLLTFKCSFPESIRGPSASTPPTYRLMTIKGGGGCTGARKKMHALLSS